VQVEDTVGLDRSLAEAPVPGGIERLTSPGARRGDGSRRGRRSNLPYG
jgi:hypothetical protein